MNENFDSVELELISEFNSFLFDVKLFNYSGDTNWTYYIKKKIANLGEKKGYKIAVGGFGDEYAREWLYDLVWYSEDLDGCLTKLSLIMESEWDKNYSGIKFDFEKLLVGNADRRLMICQSREVEINNLFNKFQDAINRFNGNLGDRFLFAILNCNTDKEFHFRTYTKQ